MGDIGLIRRFPFEVARCGACLFRETGLEEFEDLVANSRSVSVEGVVINH